MINNKGELYIRPRQTTEDKIPVMPRGFSHTGSDTAPRSILCLQPIFPPHPLFLCRETPTQPLLLPPTRISTAWQGKKSSPFPGFPQKRCSSIQGKPPNPIQPLHPPSSTAGSNRDFGMRIQPGVRWRKRRLPGKPGGNSRSPSCLHRAGDGIANNLPGSILYHRPAPG